MPSTTWNDSRPVRRPDLGVTLLHVAQLLAYVTAVVLFAGLTGFAWWFIYEICDQFHYTCGGSLAALLLIAIGARLRGNRIREGRSCAAPAQNAVE